ncbi:endonuclease VIII Nei2 [Parafrigoribacterium mesophilum]|uniref:Fpg/Nei family DNA glycosylase n=1 Tax=Parafrigoribacterium mesophilum TaxID=433646 RepID=UPI0031FD1DDB
MPEGDNVYLTAQNLNAVLAGRTLVRCDIRVPAFATVDLTGERVDEVISRGKHLLTRVGDFTIHTHLKMEGSWHIYRPDTRWRRPEWQARIILANTEWQTVGFQLGIVEVVPRHAEDSVVGHLGPDLLGSDWNARLALEQLLAAPDAPVGAALLDQRVMAGLGNVYRNELCFLRGVLPTRPVGQVNEPERLIDLAHRLINANKSRTARTTTGKLRGDTAWVYGRAGQPCLRCGTTIRHGSVGEPPRDTYWCPHCQQ